MKNYFLIGVMLAVALFFSCSKKMFDNSALAGKWMLTKICVCNSCIDTIAFYQTQTLVFSLSGQVDLYGAVGNSEEHYSGTYSVKQQSYGKVLNIDLNAPDSNKNFLFVPGCIINSESKTKLVLELNTPYANACAYANTYTQVPD
ncbi:MAG TPA: hypothetical protein VHZ50_16920 [Puia sp.]|jgi:hypothetical protein|nr:hypothetical protein [Puia sp.]